MTLLENISQMCQAFDGRAGVSILDLQTGQQVDYQGDEIFPTASVIKLPILITLMQQCQRGAASLDDPLMLRRGEMVAGSGLLRYLTPGAVLPLRDWAFLMMHVSDNLATNVIIDYVGLENVQAWLREAGYPTVQLYRKITFSEPPPDKKHFGTASPRELTQLMAAVFRRQLVSREACAEMMRMMDMVGQDRVGRYLPFTPAGSDVPGGARLRMAGKTGRQIGSRVQTAVVWYGEWACARGFAITVMTEGNPEPETYSVDAPGSLLIGRIARAAYDHLLEKPAAD